MHIASPDCGEHQTMTHIVNERALACLKAGADTRQWFNQWPHNAAAAANMSQVFLKQTWARGNIYDRSLAVYAVHAVNFLG